MRSDYPSLLTALATSLCLWATGCETARTVSRVATLQSLPAAASVEAALRAVPGMQSVFHEQELPQTNWSLYKGTIHDPAYDQFMYFGESARGVVAVRETSDGRKTLELYRLWMNQTPTPAEVDRTQALMDEAYASLRAYNPELPPPQSVRETCHRIPGR